MSLHYHDGYEVTKSVDAPGYKPEDREFDSLWGLLRFLHLPNPCSHTGPAVDSNSYRNEYQKIFCGGGGKARPERDAYDLIAICETTA
jgi:hypothetical protein